MIKNPHLLEQLRRQDIRKDRSFEERARRYDEMYKLACKLNPKIREGDSSKHLDHLVQLADSFKTIAKNRAAE